ncbi:MAG: hypothetical protein V4719_26650 [Planctomycetota bacterium]
MAALTKERPMRVDVIGQVWDEQPCAAATKIVEGAMGGLYLGYARPYQLGDAWLGHAMVTCDNTLGAAGGKLLRYYRPRYRAQVLLPNAAITDAVRGAPVFAQDSGTLSLRAGFKCGQFIRYVRSGVAIVEFDGSSDICTIAATITKAAMTDGGGTSGYYDFGMAIPQGARFLDWLAVTKSAGTGDTSATIQVGESGNVDRFSAVATNSVFATGVVGTIAPGSSDNAVLTAASTPRVTVTTGSDFGLIASGFEVDVFLNYHVGSRLS